MKLKIMKISLRYPPGNSLCNSVIITVEGTSGPRRALTCFISIFKGLVHPLLKQKKVLRAGWAALGGEYHSDVIK